MNAKQCKKRREKERKRERERERERKREKPYLKIYRVESLAGCLLVCCPPSFRDTLLKQP